MEIKRYYYMVDELAERTGGVTRLTVLLQKRAKELIKGFPRLVEIESDDPIQIAFEELVQGKISLEELGEILVTKDEKKGK